MSRTIEMIMLISFLVVTESYSNNISSSSDSVFKSSTLLIDILTVKDINGVSYSLRNKTKIFIFLDVECPISQSYTLYLEKLHLKYEKLGILFFCVFPTKYTEVEEIIVFNKKYNLTIPSVLDKFQSITKKLNATITPEVFVINPKNEICYFGGIDNNYFALGKRNLKPKIFYMEEALDSVIKNKKIQLFHNQAIGCEIQRII